MAKSKQNDKEVDKTTNKAEEVPAVQVEETESSTEEKHETYFDFNSQSFKNI